jgi:hypothetical protein
LAANEPIQPLELEDEEMLENPDNSVDVDDAINQGQLKRVGELDAHSFTGSLDSIAYQQIVEAACEAATIASLRAVQSWALSSSHSVPAPLDHPSSDGNKSETGVLKPFERTVPMFLRLLYVHDSFSAPRGKKRVPRANQDKLVDVCFFTRHYGCN